MGFMFSAENETRTKNESSFSAGNENKNNNFM